MFNELVTTDGEELLTERLNSAVVTARSLNLPTKEEYQIALINLLNSAFNLRNNMTPLDDITAETPARPDQLYANLQLLNKDAQAIITQLLIMESDVGNLYNLFAAAQNATRQQVRELVYLSTRRRYLEAFINDKQLDPAQTGYLDFATGSCMLPLLNDTSLAASSVILGTSCKGSALIPAGSTLEVQLANLIDGSSETQFTWIGPQLDLTVSFSVPPLMSRFGIQMDELQGVALSQLTASPDGIVSVDLLANTDPADRSIEGSSGKFSGEFAINFNGQYVKYLRIVFTDLVGNANISIRKLLFNARRFSSTATVTSRPITAPSSGSMVFSTIEEATPTLTSITHQISWDGIQYSAIHPGDIIPVVSSPFWYSAVFERLDSNFAQQSKPISVPGTDPALTDYYRLNTVTTSKLGNNIVERTILLDINPSTSGNRPLLLQEAYLPGTLVLLQGNLPLDPAQYTVSGSILTFPTNQQLTAVTLRYQTSELSNSGLPARKEYFSPRLHEFSFEKVA